MSRVLALSKTGWARKSKGSDGFMVAVAQLVESLTVTQVVAGSSPVGHPSIFAASSRIAPFKTTYK